MKLHKRMLLCGALSFLFTLTAFGQTGSYLEKVMVTRTPGKTGKGVVVLGVKKNLEADKAGLQNGDILLRWSRGDAKGEIASPFDLAQVEIEQAPRGAVTLEGLRGAEKQTWALGGGSWGVEIRPNLAEELLSIYLEGQKLAAAGNLQDALEHWRSAAGKVQESQSSLPSIWFLSHAAEQLAGARQWKQSDSVYEEAIAQNAGVSPAIKAQVLRSWADTFLQRADWQSAEKHYQEAMAEFEKTSSEGLLFADMLANTGYAAMQRGDLVESEKRLSQALEIQQGLAPDSLTTAKSFNGLGNLAISRSDLSAAEKYYNQALWIREKLDPDSLSVASTLNNLGVVFYNRGDLAKTKDYYLRALRIRQKVAPGSRDVGDSLNNLGNVFAASGDRAKAEEYLHQALLIRETLGPGSLDVARTLNNLGINVTELGDLNKAEDYLRRAIVIKRKLAPNSLDLAGSLTNLGHVLRQRGELKEAEEYYRQALAIHEKVAPGSLDHARSLNGMGMLAEERGDWAEAEDYQQQALVIDQKIAPAGPATVATINHLGWVALARDHQDQAEQYFRQCLTIEEKEAPGSLDVATCLTGLGNAFRDRGDLAKAEDSYRQASTIWEKLAPEKKDYAETLAALAGIMARKEQWTTAAALFEKALNALEGQIRHLGGGEETRSSFRAQHAGYYRDYIDVLIRQKQPERALQVLERSRAQTLLEMLTQAHIDVHRGVDAALIEQERSVQSDISAKVDRRVRLQRSQHGEEQISVINREIEDLLAQYNEVERQIRAGSPSYAALTQPKSLSAKETEQLLDAETVLLEYSLGEERSYLFVVSQGSLITYELPRRSQIESAARRVYEQLTARNRKIKGETGQQRRLRLAKSETQFAEATAALSQMILAPVAAQFKGMRLLIVSDGALEYIPFAVLPEPAAPGPGRAGNAKERTPLMIGHEILNLPSASVLAVLRQERVGRKEAAGAVAVLADPVFDQSDARVNTEGATARGLSETLQAAPEAEKKSSAPGSTDHLLHSAADIGLATDELNLPRLRFTRQEADAIMAVTPAEQGMKALDFEASRKTATSPELSQYRVVHFATHGLLDSEHPQLSGLVLSMVDEHGKPQNGFLELEDIYNLNLPAELVVLSACETGLGKQIQGEGLVGLTRGFMYAGASRVLASLWKVDDVATAELMKRFYEAMEKDGMRPAAALRRAQIEMWKQKDWKAPYYWAAFQMQGEWK